MSGRGSIQGTGSASSGRVTVAGWAVALAASPWFTLFLLVRGNSLCTSTTSGCPSSQPITADQSCGVMGRPVPKSPMRVGSTQGVMPVPRK
jgi:hypothetical protein